MKRIGWLTFAIALAMLGGHAALAAEKPPAMGVGPTYETLGTLPVGTDLRFLVDRTTPVVA